MFFPKELKDLDHLLVQLQQISGIEKTRNPEDSEVEAGKERKHNQVEFPQLIDAFIESKIIADTKVKTEIKDVDHLITHLQEIYENAQNTNTYIQEKLKSGIRWTGDHIEFAELIKSLIEAKKISGTTEKAIFEDLCSFLGVENFKKDNRIKGLKKRIHNKTPFLLELEMTLNAWIENEG